MDTKSPIQTRIFFAVEYGEKKIPLENQISCVKFIKENNEADFYTITIRSEIYKKNVWQHYYKTEIVYIFGEAFFPGKIHKIMKSRICHKYKGKRQEIAKNLRVLEKNLEIFKQKGCELIVLSKFFNLYQTTYKNLNIIDDKGNCSPYSEILSQKKKVKDFFAKQFKSKIETKNFLI